MATGTAFGGQCYATSAEAAAMWCSAHGGVTSAGSVVCITTTGFSSSSGGEVSGVASLRLYPSGSTAQTNTSVGFRLQACETYGLDYWAPYQAAWIALVLVIASGRTVIKRFFTHQSA